MLLSLALPLGAQEVPPVGAAAPVPTAVERAIEALKAEKNPEALAIVEGAVKQDDWAAVTLLGLMYQRSLGVSEDEEKAAGLFRRAAEAGHPPAAYHLGNCYAWGAGVPYTREGAVKWYYQAAEAGFPHAQHELGMHHMVQSIGGEPNSAYDLEKARGWFAKAAAGNERYPGRPEALTRLAFLHFNAGERALALDLLTRAGKKGDALAQWRLAKWYEAGWPGATADPEESYCWWWALTRNPDGGLEMRESARARCLSLESRLTPEQVARARKKALGKPETPAGTGR